MKFRKFLSSVCLCIFMVAGIAPLLTGCAGREASPEEVAKNFCEALKRFDLEAMQSYIVHADGNTPTEEWEELTIEAPDLWQYLKEQLGKIEYSLGDAAITGDTASLSVRFTHSDISPAVQAAVADYIQQALVLSLAGASDEVVEQLLYTTIMTKLNSVPAVTANTDVTFSFLHMKDGWKIDNGSEAEMANVITCNMGRALEAFGNSEGASLSDEFPDTSAADGDALSGYEENEGEEKAVQIDSYDYLSDFLGEWEAVDGDYPYMEISPQGGKKCHVVITNKFGQVEADAEYDEHKAVIMYFDGTYSTRK